MDKFHVHNHLNMSERENNINTSDYAFNKTLRKMRKNYTTKIHVLEKPPKEFEFHPEGPSRVLKSTNRKRPRTLTIPKPAGIKDKKNDLEIIDALTACREVERRSSHMDLSKLFKTSRKPHLVLTKREIKDIQRNDSNHDEVMSNQIKKMKEGIQRLQEITQKFNCTETYKEDVDYLIRNVKQAISRG